MDIIQKTIIAIKLAELSHVTVSELASVLGCDRKSAWRILARLLDLGVLYRTSGDNQREPDQYHCAPFGDWNNN